MATDCRNIITFTGPEESITAITNIAVRRDVDIYENTIPKLHTKILPFVFDLESLHPNPFNSEVVVDATESEKSAHAEEKHLWYCENHGTSRTNGFEEIENSSEKYVVKLYSNFAPPLRAFHKISKDYPALTIEIDFWGIGSGFCGTYTYRNGECVLKEYFENDEYDALFTKDPREDTANDYLASTDHIAAIGDNMQDLFAAQG